MSLRTIFAYILLITGFTLILTAFPFQKNDDQAAATVHKDVEETARETTPTTTSLISQSSDDNAELPVFTKESLAGYNGEDPSLPIYLAFEGKVYDVTEGAAYYAPGGAYDFLAGTDGTTLLKIAGGGIIKKKYPVIGTYTE